MPLPFRSAPCASYAAGFPDPSFVFTTERGGPFTADAINRRVKRIDWQAGVNITWRI